MNSTAPSISKPLPLRLGLTAVFVLLCAGMHAVATRHNLVTVMGTPSLLYNLGTIPFLALTGASFFSAGGLILPAGATRTRLDAFLLRSIAGLCLFSFLGYALGMAGLLLPWVCIPVLALPLYFSPYATFYKPQKYMRMILNPYTEGLDVKLGRDAEKARAIYFAQGLRHFVVTLATNPAPMISLVEESHCALFSPENVARYFRVRHVTDIWLLVLDGTDAALGWKPAWDMREALEITYAWFTGHSPAGAAKP